MFKSWAREALAPLINRQVTPGLTFNDYRYRVHHLNSEEPRRLDSALPEVGYDDSPPPWRPRKRTKWDTSGPKTGESGPSKTQYASHSGEHSRRALSEPSVIAVDDTEALDFPDEPEWGIDKLIDFKIERSEKRWLVKWQSAYIEQKYIHGKNDEERYVVIEGTRKTWMIKREVDRSHSRAGIVHVLWHDTWLKAEELRGHRHLMDKLQRASPIESYQMTTSERKRYLAMYYEKAGWVDVTPGHDVFDPVRDILNDSNTKKQPKTNELLQEPQLRAVLLHGHRFDKNAALRRFHLTKPTLHAILLQGTGKVADSPCKLCREHDGVLIGGCVISSTLNAWFNGACACCQIAGKSTKCEHHKNNTSNNDSSDAPARPRTRPKKRIRYVETPSEGSDDDQRSGYGPKTPPPNSSPPPLPPSPVISIKSPPKEATVKPSRSPEPAQLSSIPIWQPEAATQAGDDDLLAHFDDTVAAVIEIASQEEAMSAAKSVAQPSSAVDNLPPTSTDMSRTLFVTPGPADIIPPFSGPVVSEIAIGRGSARPPGSAVLQAPAEIRTTTSPLAGKMLPPRAPTKWRIGRESPRGPAADRHRYNAARGQQDMSLPLPQFHAIKRHSPTSIQLKVNHHQPAGRRPSPREVLAAAQSSQTVVPDGRPPDQHIARRAQSADTTPGSKQASWHAETVPVGVMSLLGQSVRCANCPRQFIAHAHHFDAASGQILCTPCGKAAVREQRRRASLGVAGGLSSPRRPYGQQSRDHNAGKLRRVSVHGRRHEPDSKRFTKVYPPEINLLTHKSQPAESSHAAKHRGEHRSSSYTPRPRKSSYNPRVYEKSQCAGSLDGLPVFVLTSP